MHFITATVIFGMISTAIAAPQPEAKGNHGAVGEAGGFFPGSTNSACYCCPSSGEGTSCGRVDEQGRCRNGDVLICCDLREQACSNLATLAVPDGSTGLLDIGGLLTTVINDIL